MAGWLEVAVMTGGAARRRPRARPPFAAAPWRRKLATCLVGVVGVGVGVGRCLPDQEGGGKVEEGIQAAAETREKEAKMMWCGRVSLAGAPCR